MNTIDRSIDYEGFFFFKFQYGIQGTEKTKRISSQRTVYKRKVEKSK